MRPAPGVYSKSVQHRPSEVNSEAGWYVDRCLSTEKPLYVLQDGSCGPEPYNSVCLQTHEVLCKQGLSSQRLEAKQGSERKGLSRTTCARAGPLWRLARRRALLLIEVKLHHSRTMSVKLYARTRKMEQRTAHASSTWSVSPLMLDPSAWSSAACACAEPD